MQIWNHTATNETSAFEDLNYESDYLNFSMSSPAHPKNPWIRNGRLAEVFLWATRYRIPGLRELLNLIFHSELACPLPARLFIPHPYGINVGAACVLGENVTLMQQVTLGGKNPYPRPQEIGSDFPQLREGVYVGVGARILGGIVIGEWAIIGANAVVTKDVPARATVVEYNRILKIDSPT